MKKISLLVLICMILSLVFASCDLIKPQTPDEEKHEHAYSTNWSFDAVNHYHACTCGSQSDVAKHADGNNDGACDTCAIILSNEHVFDTAWVTDSNNHWHPSLCGHDVVDAKAAHTPDKLGTCTVCGMKCADASIATVAEAIEIASAQKDFVKVGSFGSKNYEFRSDCFYVVDTESGVEYYYSANGEDVLGVIKTEVTSYPNVNATVDNLLGVEIDIAYVYTFYGAEDLLVGLWEEANENNALADDLVTSVADGVYSFTFGFYNYGLYIATVEFTLDEEKFFADSVKINIDEYYSYTNTYTEGEDGKCTVNEGAEPDNTYAYEIKQQTAQVNPFTPEMFTVTDFKFVDENGDEITAATMELGYTGKVYIGFVTPDTVDLEFTEVTLAENDYFYGYFLSTNNSISIGTLDGVTVEAGNYNVDITVGEVTKTLAISVINPVVENVAVYEMVENEWNEIVRDYYEDYDGNFIYLEKTNYEFYAGQKVMIGVSAPKGTNGTTLVATDANDQSVTLTEFDTSNYWDDEAGTYFDIVIYDLSVLKAGEYTLVFTSVDNTAVSETVNVKVKALKTLEEVFSGIYTYKIWTGENAMWGVTYYDKITVTFTIDTDDSYSDYIDAENNMAAGTVTIVTLPVESAYFGDYEDESSKETVSYRFDYANGAFTFMNNFGQTVSIGYELRLNELNNLQIGVVNVEYDNMYYTAGIPELVLGNNAINAANTQWQYVAGGSEVLNLAASNAIGGDVSVTYTVNDGNPVALTNGTNASLVLAKGDTVVVDVVATGYATLTATAYNSLKIGNNNIEAADVNYIYTATEAGTLNLAAGNAIGDVAITYTVNGEAAVTLANGTNVDLVLNAGDVVIVSVVATGYLTLSATWTATAA